MEEHKKKVIILISVILVFIALIAILLGIIFKDEKVDNPISTPNNNQEDIISKDIVRLNESEDFFGIQKAINNYYLLLTNKKTNELMQALDADYKKEKNINTNNLYNVIKSDYENISFIAKEIYYNPNSSITYYFVNGYLIDMKMLEEDFYYEGSINYLIIKNKNNNYVIKPLDNNTNIESIAKSYVINNKDIDNNYRLSFDTISEESKLTSYITEFMSLLMYDNKRAYQLLDDNTKNKYLGYDDFNSKLVEIYNTLSSKIFSYSSSNKNGKTIYNIIDDKQNNITIYENNIMDYKIAY